MKKPVVFQLRVFVFCVELRPGRSLHAPNTRSREGGKKLFDIIQSNSNDIEFCVHRAVGVDQCSCKQYAKQRLETESLDERRLSGAVPRAPSTALTSRMKNSQCDADTVFRPLAPVFYASPSSNANGHFIAVMSKFILGMRVILLY